MSGASRYQFRGAMSSDGGGAKPSAVATGSSLAPFESFQELDAFKGSNTGLPVSRVSIMVQYQSISCMAAYHSLSFEEIRVQDYGHGVKNSSAPAELSKPQFAPVEEHEESVPFSNPSGIVQYQSISCMPFYRDMSFEELRIQDYEQGRKDSNAAADSSKPQFEPSGDYENPVSGPPLPKMLHYQSISCMPVYGDVSFEELRVQDYGQGRKVSKDTAEPQFEPFTDYENPRDPSTLMHFQSITCMPFYRHLSFEELRVQHYAKNRKSTSTTDSTQPPGPLDPEFINAFKKFSLKSAQGPIP